VAAPPARRRGLAAGCAVWLECSVRLPGQERTGTPVNDVEDYRLVVD